MRTTGYSAKILLIVALSTSWLSAEVSAFQLHSTVDRSVRKGQRRSPVILRLSSTERNETPQSEVKSNSNVNGDPSAAAGDGSPGFLTTFDDAKSQLFSAFTALDQADQYDAVLTGLCAKILDQPGMAAIAVRTAIENPLQLLEEMNGKRIPASPRSLMALVDSAVKAEDVEIMAMVLASGKKNGGIRAYGSLQADIIPLPPSPSSRVRVPGGGMKSRSERLATVPPVPTDERGAEVVGALAFAGVLAICTLANFFHMDDIAPLFNGLVALLVTVGVVDNLYDVIKVGSRAALQQLDKDKTREPMKLPDKESLPLGLGTGKLSGTVVRGLTRLLTVDAERECECEAAALFTAYSLGLPCFSFQPNALEASVLAVESVKTDRSAPMDSLLTSSGITRILVWIFSATAMESSKHTQLIVSDPREASSFLTRLEDFAEQDASVAKELWWRNDEQERQDLLTWAYAEADLLLRENKAAVNAIMQRLVGGAATVGDCIAVLEKW